MKANYLLVSIFVVVVGAGGFFAGMKFQEGKQPVRQFNGQGQRSRMGFRPVSGEIIASDDKSTTVKLQDGSSKVVLLTSNTQINKADTASKSDLKTGERVAVFGAENSDGSITAQNVQLNPVARGSQ